ncbi:transcriptional repressor NrdR [candidate division WS5 bacterium]|uniref:Transcriptional repressor NrdR n=1 Tax=candidate division WS5 bacterium TaxID=2093353 RepID=A0A419DE86_9BACT|nr:MAG: transcriptional repressor NrdR [candidate division WS5 bacterium]
MDCPKCKSNKIKVLEKRNAENESVIRRRRECEACGFRFTTYERVETAILTVIKKNGQKESFSEEKLKKGIERALEKRPVTGVEMDKLVEDIERELRSEGISEVKSSKIGDIVLSKLKKLDDVAYMRFASVYKSFETIDSFKKELEKISG